VKLHKKSEHEEQEEGERGKIPDTNLSTSRERLKYCTIHRCNVVKMHTSWFMESSVVVQVLRILFNENNAVDLCPVTIINESHYVV
jgi:hypothetical protein